MNGSEDYISLIPSEYDLIRLDSIKPDQTVVAENGSWTVNRYPEKPGRKDWMTYTIALSVTGISTVPPIIEANSVREVVKQLTKIEKRRAK